MSTPVSNYISRATLKALLRDDRPSPNPFDAAYDVAIAAASGSIDEHCDDQFWQEPIVIARPFVAEDVRVLWTGSFASTTGLVVKFDLDDDGVFETTVPSTSYQAGPTNKRADRPFDRIELLAPFGRFPGAWRGDPYCGYQTYNGAGTYFSYGYGTDRRFRSQRARVEVTAHWGWPSVPWQVVQAAQILAVQNYKSKDMTGATAGTPTTSGGSFGAQAAYPVRGGAGMNAAAAALLCGLRDTVIA